MDVLTRESILIEVNGQSLEAPSELPLLEVLHQAGYDVPSLCYRAQGEGESECAPSSCRLCQVEIDGQLATACERSAAPGMEVRTDTARAREAQQFALDLICEAHQGVCLDCPANQTCKLQELSGRLRPSPLELETFSSPNGKGQQPEEALQLFPRSADLETASIRYDASLCVLCGRCAAVCPTSAIGPIGRGAKRVMGPPPGMDFAAACINCGQCTKVCPTGALSEQSHIYAVEQALANVEKTVVFQIAPAVRVALGEAFGLPPGKQLTGKIYAALRRMGRAYAESKRIPLPFEDGEIELRSNVLVTDTNVTADLTILEEGNEIVSRIQKGGAMPVLTSCCPAWVRYVESYHPELIPNLCTAKSPQQMMGALIKTYGAESWDLDPADIVSVSVMPCTAKKYEAERPEMNASGHRDVDYVITTRELARMLKRRGLSPVNFSEEQADYPFEEYTGAGTIFGNTGGVMEAALRTLYNLVSGEELDNVEFKAVRGLSNLKEATVEINGQTLKVAILHNLNYAKTDEFMEQILNPADGQPYAAIEVMACPGGCIGGGGQPKEFDNTQIKAQRSEGLNLDDMAHRYRRSHKSPVIERIYSQHLGEPNSAAAHRLCHTHYEDRSQVLEKE